MVGLIAAVLGSVVASAPVKEVKLPPTPVVFDAICETETNVVQSVWFEGVREVSVRMTLLGDCPPQGWQWLLVSRRGRTSRIRAREWTKLCVSTEEWEK